MGQLRACRTEEAARLLAELRLKPALGRVADALGAADAQQVITLGPNAALAVLVAPLDQQDQDRAVLLAHKITCLNGKDLVRRDLVERTLDLARMLRRLLPTDASYSYLAAARADFPHRLDRTTEARTSYEEAMLLTENIERDFLTTRLRQLGQ